MAVLFRDRLAFAKAQLAAAPCDDMSQNRVSSVLVRPLQTMLGEFCHSLPMEEKVRVSTEIMAVPFATKDLDLLLAMLFSQMDPKNKKRGVMADYRAFVAFFLA